MKKTIEIADRFCYSIFNISLPKDITHKNIDTIIRAKLVSLYPLPLNDKTILVLNNPTDRNSRIVIVCNHGFFAKNKHRVCSSILAIKLLKRKTGICICIDTHFIEYITLDQGRFISSTVLSRTKDAALPNILREHTIAVIFNTKDRKLSQGIKNNAILFFDLSALPASTVQCAMFAAFSPEQKRNKIILALLFVMLLLVIGAVATHQRIQIIAEKHMLEHSETEQMMKREQEQKQKESLVQNLQTEYTDSVRGRLPDMFDVCNKVFLSIDSGTKIDNLTITGAKFQFGAHGNDAIKILTQYEENEFITGIYLNRVVVEGLENSFTFNGEVKQRIILPPDDDVIDRKIAFYQQELERFQEEEHIKQERRPSEISNIIREIISQNRCQLESIQYYNTEYGLEIEYAIQTRSASFFAFLQDVSKSDAYLVISSVRIRSYLAGGTLSAIIRFRTGIMLDDDNVEDGILPEDIESLTPQELAEYFISQRNIPAAVPVKEDMPAAVPLKEDIPEVIMTPSIVRNPSFLQYVGSAGTSQGGQFVLVKDTRKDVVIKVSNNPEQENYFISNEVNRLELKYEDTFYEVQK